MAIGNLRAFTLIEMLVVIGILGALAGMLTTVIVYALHLSRRVECQQNLNHIGQAVNTLVLSNNGLYPHLTNAYPRPQVTTAGGATSNDLGFPWWARVFEQWEGDMGLLYARNPDGTYVQTGPVDANFNPNGHMLTAQLPLAMSGLHCRMGGALDGSSVANLFNSISYGLNFDVKDFGVPANVPPIPPRPYCASSTSSPYSPTFPSSLTTYDKQPDQYRTTEIHALSEFILISEANTQDPNPANWTGGRISMGAITRTGSDSPPNNAPIVGRHSGYANVLFADGHVDAIEIAPGQGPSRDINMNTPLWTLPGN